MRLVVGEELRDARNVVGRDGGRKVAQCSMGASLSTGRAQSSNRWKTTQALCPPKPKLFETATFTSASRASFGT